MAFFFSGLSSSIGKKLLLYGLRQIDILDKDPADFVSVDVGKRTTLEVRDVGLHVKKLIALLHLKLPPEIQLSGARASLLRVAFVLEFGVPQISIEVDGIQVQARLLDDAKEPEDTQQYQVPWSSHRRTSLSNANKGLRNYDSDDDEHVPTVDELAKSFMRTEPDNEIFELEQELENRPSYMQESFASSDDGDEGSAGMGAPLSLPSYLRNILNTALDRLSIVINDINIEMEDSFIETSSDAVKPRQDSPAALKFHIERISIDSLTAHDVRVDVQSSQSAAKHDSKSGKRRLHVENICARLVSDVDNFVSMSRTSQPSSPVTNRSEVSVEQDAPNQPLETKAHSGPQDQAEDISLETTIELARVASPIATSIHLEASNSSMHAPSSPPRMSTSLDQPDLTQSMRTVDDDRFADAASDDGYHDGTDGASPVHSRQSLPHENLGCSSILYDDEGLLEYAMQNSLLNPRFDDAPAIQDSVGDLMIQGLEGTSTSHHSYLSELSNNASTLNLPTVSALGRSFHPPERIESPSQSAYLRDLSPQVDNLVHAHDQVDEPEQGLAVATSVLASPPSPADDLAESQLFTHDDAESMYMSAISAAQSDLSSQRQVPGGWDSSSASSRAASSESSETIPDDMISGSILNPLPEVDDGYETPRPGSRQTSTASPQLPRAKTPTSQDMLSRKQSKLFLTIDEITVWFPLGLDGEQLSNADDSTSAEATNLDFKPPNLGEDSIFAEMPGSFSNYAHSSSHRRNPSTEESVRLRSTPKPRQPEDPLIKSPKCLPSALISIDVGSVAGHMDISTGRIMFGMFNRALQAFTGDTEQHNTTTKPNEVLDHVNSSLELSIKHIGISWLENILADSVLDPTSTRLLKIDPIEAILRINLAGLHLTNRTSAQGLRAKLHIAKLLVGSLDHDIISFQSPRPRSNRSVSALPSQLKHDVEIDIEPGKDKRVTVVTRPVKVMFDVQKLDDALGAFGGFSGMLELSSSISSSSNVQNSTVVPAQLRPRGVHFGDGLPPPVKTSPVSTVGPKIQVQFGEVALTLKGKACAVQLQTTSVRVAVRESNVRLKVSEIQLLGPYVDAGQTGTPLVVEIRGTTINFLFMPEETDLGRLISLITPSKDPYENNDDILIDTLLRQRRKGSVLRAEVDDVGLRISDLQQMKIFEALGAELVSLSKVTKYLPEDDRPGLLTLASVKRFDARVAINEQLGDVTVALENAAVAHVGVPALLAAEIGSAVVTREDEILVHEVVKLRSPEHLPAIMIRMVGDEMEPVAKAKLFNLCIEYRVSTIMAALGMSETGTADEIALGIASSVATITGAPTPVVLSRKSSQASSPTTSTAKPLQVDLLLRNCAIGLNPRKASSKGLFVLTEAHVAGKQMKNDYSVVVELRKASMHAIDDIARLEEERDLSSLSNVTGTNRYLKELGELGFVSLSSISAAKVHVSITGDGDDTPQLVDVEFKNELFVIESCADSTQTLMAILNGLQPPTPPSNADKYRTVVPLQEMMESFTGDAFIPDDDAADADDFMQNADLVEDEVPTNLEFVGSFYNSQSLPTDEEMGNSLLGEDDLDALATPPTTRQRDDRALLESFQERHEVVETEPGFAFNETYFVESDSERQGKARKWDSAKNQYHLSNEFKVPDAPLKVRVRDVNVIWNLYDGYDWPRTRNIISQAVDDVEARAEERRQQARDEEDDDDFVEEDFLFNSVWIGVPVKDEKGALARRINHDIDDLVSETGSYATSTATRSTGATARPRSSTKSRRRLKLERSKHKKIAFSIMGVAVDLIIFPPNSGETISSVDVRVRDLEVFDHVPTSTWKKFVTCAVDPAARELNRPMINLELVTVKPVTDLAASELVIKVTVLPLRLHVDQDALDFITRFFEFKDDSVPTPPPSADQPFIQRLEVMAVSMKLDYKPKRVDYRGLRSGHTTEFMNFLILDGSDITLRHAIVYGITSFDKLHKILNDIWTPDVKNNQLPGVLAGLAAIRPLVNVGSGVRDLVVVPVREYKKDGRIVRSLQKGMYAFAKNTTSEVARLGAKVAIGTQNLLEGAEVFLNPQTGSSSRQQQPDWDGEDPNSDAEEPRAVSHYANQPLGVRAGLRSAVHHLERDILMARDAVIAIPQEVMEEGSGVGVARAIARHAPTIILKPALGATKAVSNALLGVGNALDQDSRRKVEDKYKSY
ncbi:hypothetical protein T440DRAFT_515630 [Plenodomus tracheiphilus IPT5]|uniref:Autophagy-related protein 2 n=1 Tax=Plenodomus tracheiphilus IPT5 TaxID=1408161 RepID=A0A6A7BFN2_9PLEO|nr:hypothetical protein T440DRAFT_515630 [Plenodomus tracheiphilus IPT5]